MSDYSDMLSMPRPQSLSHKKMPIIERAAQFLPYATLGDYFDSVEEQNRITELQRELSEQDTELLNRKLQALSKGDAVRITHFAADKKKEGGKYIITAGTVRQVDPVYRCIFLNNAESIAFSDILNLETDE